MLQVDQTVTAYDLARALHGEQGTFIARQNLQSFKVTASPGHSITSLTPLGPPVSGVLQASALAAEPWSITKISDQDISLTGDQNQAGNNQSRQQGR